MDYMGRTQGFASLLDNFNGYRVMMSQTMPAIWVKDPTKVLENCYEKPNYRRLILIIDHKYKGGVQAIPPLFTYFLINKTNKMEKLTIVETKHTKKAPVAIKPYFDASVSNMGLEDYGLSLFDGVKHHEQLACIERNGVVYYLTGLNEFAPDIRVLPEEEKNAKIKHIREAVSELEKELASNVITDLEDPDFWNKVKLLKPDNAEFWNRISISCGNEPLLS